MVGRGKVLLWIAYPTVSSHQQLLYLVAIICSGWQLLVVSSIFLHPQNQHHCHSSKQPSPASASSRGLNFQLRGGLWRAGFSALAGQLILPLWASTAQGGFVLCQVSNCFFSPSSPSTLTNSVLPSVSFCPSFIKYLFSYIYINLSYNTCCGFCFPGCTLSDKASVLENREQCTQIWWIFFFFGTLSNLI
jgi:hypothetical protein